MRSSALVLFVFLLALSACAAPATLPAATEEPPAAPTAPPATETPVAVEATPTPAPSHTPTATPPNAAVTPTETHTWRSESPDGAWTALGFLRGPLTAEGRDDYRLLFEIHNAAGELVWTVFDEYLPAELGFGLPEVYRWAQDEGVVYLTHRTVADGCGILVDGSDLLRFDLESGQLETLFPGEVRAIGLSPDNGTLAYVPWGPAAPKVILLDLTSGEERSTTLEGYAESAVAGALTWSPDGHALALTVAENPCLGDWRQTIVRLDVEVLTAHAFITSDRSTSPALLSTAGWQDKDTLLLQDDSDQEWLFDLDNETLTPVE